MKIQVFWEIPANGEKIIDVYDVFGIDNNEWTRMTELEKHEHVLRYVLNNTGASHKEQYEF